VVLSEADIKSNLESLEKRIARACLKARRTPSEVTLIAVTKTVDPASIEFAHNLGLRHFGENRVQEAEVKIKALSQLRPHPTWHMIGHLQSNKIKPALELFDTIQSVDSLKLALAISQRSHKKFPILLQVNVAAEATKSGFSVDELRPAWETISLLPGIEVRGLMTIGPLVEDVEKVRPVFRKLREMRDSLRLEHLSMGMTDDFEIAIEEGATMIRVGRAIFGERG
jgi:pyridoxal phosphate enzyme (YggS family)